jgi:hypothetical protein
MSTDKTIIQFAAALANQRQVDLDTLHPHARIIMTGPFATNYPESYSAVLSEWLILGDAAALAIPCNEENKRLVRHITASFTELVFSFPGHRATEPPDAFHDTPMGRIWNMARCWAEDDLITLTEAAALASVSVAAISQNKHLSIYRDFAQANRQRGYRLVKRADVLNHYKEKINEA